MIVSDDNNRGSTWQIWDLHVHSPASYGGSFEEFIQNVSISQASVVGINDYCTTEGYQEIVNLGGVHGKVLFPVVEFRMHNLLTTKHSKSGVRINFHIIFDNDPSVFPKITTWLNSLKCYDEKGKSIQLGIAKDLSKTTFDLDKIVESLKEYDLHETHSLIWLPYDEYGGIDEIDPISDGYFKASLIDKAHLMGSSTEKQINFFKWADPKYSHQQYEKWFSRPKPCIKGSDAHKIDYPFGCLRNSNSEPIEKYCWLKTELTFIGLKQVLIEPDRIFIGPEPELLKRVRTNKTKFIRSLSIDKTDSADVDDIWFDNFFLELNSSLVAIIGNKGSGKSAITDVIALCGNTHQDSSNFSFLTKNKFRKIKPQNLSERFEACLTWEDNSESKMRLSENPDHDSPERVRYIPQSFLENLCTNIETEEFEKELKQIIYSHTPDEKRLGYSSLDELIGYKSSFIQSKIQDIKNDIVKINKDIAGLENKGSRSYFELISNSVRLKKRELRVHLSIKPAKQIWKEKDERSKGLEETVNNLRSQVKKMEEQIEARTAKKSLLYKESEELDRAFQAFSGLKDTLEKRMSKDDEFIQILQRNRIKPTDILDYSINLEPIVLKRNDMLGKIASISLDLDVNNTSGKAAKLITLRRKLNKEQQELDKPARERQAYVTKLDEWTQQKKSIEGSSTTDGSLRYFEDTLRYIKDELPILLQIKLEERLTLLRQLFTQKIELVKVREELFRPVTEFIEQIPELKSKYEVELDVLLELRSFEDDFTSFISQNKTGSYFGKEDGYQRLSTLKEKTNFDLEDSVVDFVTDLVDSLKFDKRFPKTTPIDIATQLRQGKELEDLYDFIFQLDYVQPVYNLKLGKKTLTELSPGERGALLLIFYLILDQSDFPLLIDQPEDNLDNESIYHILVQFIKMVKGTRQIIIVTHNPNLAIVCDAEQIVHIEIDKKNKNAVSFLSGAIETDRVNESVVNILEGTFPAFNNRDAKYIRHPA